jgi:hypothetical protein
MSTEFKLTVEMENAAFSDDENAELVRILRDAAQRIEDGAVSGYLRDVNGNKVGEFST